MSDADKTPVTQDELTDLDDAYVGADVNEDEFESVPDGKYQVNVDSVELVRTTKGDPMLKWKLRILGPKFAGRVLWRNNVMASSENIRWLKKDLYTCGLRLAKLSELPANLDRLLDVKLEVTKKTRGEFESVYFNKQINTGGGSPSPNTDDALSRF